MTIFSLIFLNISIFIANFAIVFPLIAGNELRGANRRIGTVIIRKTFANVFF